MKKNERRFPAEWEKQSGVQLTWPDEETEWEPYLYGVIECYRRIAREIAKHEPLIIACRNAETCRRDLTPIDMENIRFVETPLNDTWSRDHGPISIFGEGGERILLDFIFNGWGLKYHANYDNKITENLYNAGAFAKGVKRCSMSPFVLEGGSIDTDGEGTLLTTTKCLCSINRNEHLTRDEIEEQLKEALGLKRVLWLDYGYIPGDDTDCHVDTLARFCSPDTIAYAQCRDKEDECYEELLKMEQQLMSFRTAEGKPYNLVPLPLPRPRYLDDYRLPVTYVNFLVINDAVLMPTCGDDMDLVAADSLQKAFPGRRVVPIDCNSLLSGHGSLHCVTMQYPEGFISHKK